jgi:hypothetical protein
VLPNNHLTDPQIVLWLDGELEFPAMNAHMRVCLDCQDRAAAMRVSMEEFSWTYRDSLETQLPPAAGPRALLRARLESYSAARNPGWWDRLFAGQASIAASLMVASLVVFAVLAHGRRGGDLSVPKNDLTPGETRNVSVDDVCAAAPENSGRSVPVSLRQQVFREYGIKDQRPNAYEVDYLITPELGGSGSIRNLWPQPYSSVWNAHVKDELEERLHGLVCAGQVDLATAQREISKDWISAYKKYFHTNRPF